MTEERGFDPVMPQLSASPGYRRRIIIEPGDGIISAELEDDYHRIRVLLRHEAGLVTHVGSEMLRWPWTSCPGAMDVLAATFVGARLEDCARRGEKRHNCTHLYDLLLFAAAHALDDAATLYDIAVSDPAQGRRRATLSRNRRPLLDWQLDHDLFLSPVELAGSPVHDLGKWISTLEAQGDSDLAEAARALRWAAMLALGRAMNIPAGLSATAFPAATCYTFQPEQARDAIRRQAVERDFSRTVPGPLADRAILFDGDG